MDQLPLPQFSLSAELLVQLFPFHLALNHQLQIVQAGQALDRIYPHPLRGRLFADHFSINRPRMSISIEDFLKKRQSLFLLESRDLSLVLKGQMVDLLESEIFLFLCSPSAIDAQKLTDIGIQLKDFPLHDVTPDLVFLQQTTQMSVKQVENLNQQLITSQEQLKDALSIQEHLRFKAEKQARQLEQQLKELKETQIQLVQSEKMSTLGQMISGIVHEINNPLHFIHGNLDHCLNYVQDLLEACQILLKASPRAREWHEISHAHSSKSWLNESMLDQNIKDLNPEEQNTDCVHSFDATAALAGLDLENLAFALNDFPKVLQSMRIGSQRIREIVEGLRQFSRLDASALDWFDIHEGIDNTLMILRSRLAKAKVSSGIEIIKNYGNVPLVSCYGGQINQVFMNILANAIDALEDHNQACELPARSGPKREPPRIWIETVLTNPEWLRISIRDNGCGMPRDIQSKLFEPFFTTKSAHRGTGLGMSISYKIVTERHGGRLRCTSEPCKGTEFVIELPIEPAQLQGKSAV
ncbi:ATP-binding protein [Limnothrix redekei]|uniref:ATP-binding protein n=1 Tax=Limnothrix redekei LRLZ20PSL1 TaxID=3112953 RepID=A0ABW7C474_9CYAN